MTCSQCHRRVKDTPQAKVKHVVKYHSDFLLTRGFAALFDSNIAFTLGQNLGRIARMKLNQVYYAGKSSIE